MSDDTIREALEPLQGEHLRGHRPPDDVVARARRNMLDVFDGIDVPEAAPDSGGLAEIVALVERSPSTEVAAKRTRWFPLLAVAAALLLIAAIAGSVRYARTDEPSSELVAETDAVSTPVGVDTGSSNAGAGTASGGSTLELPMLVHGRFSSDELGVGVSFTALQPIWLVRAESGILVFASDPDDPMADLLEIARPNSPTGPLTNSTLPEVLQIDSAEFGGLINPIDVDGVDSIYWRGRVDDAHAAAGGCTPGAVCVPLYLAPTELGLRSGRLIDLIERPTSGATTLLMYSTPSFPGLEPFDGPFQSVIESIQFEESTTGSATS